MTKIQTVNPQGDHWIVHTDDYDIQFAAVEVTVTGETGAILENASTKVTGTSTEVLGILAEDTDGTGFVRVMVRGNPSQVNGKSLDYNTSTKADIDALLEEKGIVVVNDY